jgi:two-component system KDP operon response regulator KdpE
MSPGPAKSRVLVIDDEVQVRRLLRLTLENAGYAIWEAGTGQAGLAEIVQRQPEVVILDLGLPDMPGVDVLRRMREWSRIPVLILSIFGQEENKIAGLDAGADDYLTKPFGGGELLARVRALLRRQLPGEAGGVVRFGSVEVDFARRSVTKSGVRVRLTVKEYGLLRLLLTHADRVVTHRQMLNEIWGPSAEERTHYLRIFMLRLRRKLEDEPDNPKHLLTESGIGYRFISDPING